MNLNDEKILGKYNQWFQLGYPTDCANLCYVFAEQLTNIHTIIKNYFCDLLFSEMNFIKGNGMIGKLSNLL